MKDVLLALSLLSYLTPPYIKGDLIITRIHKTRAIHCVNLLDWDLKLPYQCVGLKYYPYVNRNDINE